MNSFKALLLEGLPKFCSAYLGVNGKSGAQAATLQEVERMRSHLLAYNKVFVEQVAFLEKRQKTSTPNGK